jgi:hypothetical protein
MTLDFFFRWGKENHVFALASAWGLAFHPINDMSPLIGKRL